MAAAVLIAFALVTLLTGSAYGALETVKSKAARYFGGHVSVTGYADGGRGMQAPGAVVETLRSSGLPIRTVAPRTVHSDDEAVLLFGGESVRMRRMNGIDFEAEHEEFADLGFVAGGVGGMRGASGENGILVSRVLAELLGVRLGDGMTLQLTTDSGQYNTATLVVRGIFEEASIFGYAVYLKNADLNRLLGRPAQAATDVAVYARQGTDRAAFADRVHTLLAAAHPVFPPLSSMSELEHALDRRDGDAERLAVLSLDAHLAQITRILDAFLAVTYFVLVSFMLIVMMGILNTYRVLVYERTREIGTMRAIGMGRLQVRALFLLEAAGLAFIASAAGLLVGLGLLEALRLVDLGGIPASGLFTVGGRIDPYLDGGVIGTNAAIVIAGVLLAALGPANRAARLDPAQTMREKS
jgi:ABC-type lipoprotein release transport system permease subunit